MLPILPEIVLRPAAVTLDADRPVPSVQNGFSDILQGLEVPVLPEPDMAGRAASVQYPFEISTPGTASFHFSRPLDLQVTGKVLPLNDAPAPDDGNPLPSPGPAPLTQAAVSHNQANQSANPDAQPSEETENPFELGREDVEVQAAHLAVGEQGPISAKTVDPAHAGPAMAARVAPFKLPNGVRMAGPVPIREATIVPVAQEQLAQHVNPIQASAELPVLAAGVASHPVSPEMGDASGSGPSPGASSAFPASSAPSVNSATSAPPAAAADPATVLAVNAPAPAPVAAPSTATGVAEPRAMADLETAIEHLAEAREAGRAARSQVTLSHQEFGAISLKIDASGNDLRATLASRDPGFVPAIQAALAERGISASGESASTQSQRGGDQSPGHQGQSQQGNSGNGGMSDPRYAFSSGSGNASNLPYRDQNGASKDEQGGPARSREGDDPESESAQGGLFA